MTQTDDMPDFSLGEVGGLEDHLQGRKAEMRQDYLVEWGVRSTDQALILHFYRNANKEPWEESSDITSRLEHAITTVLDPQRVTAGYQEEENSFFVISDYGSVPDVRLLVSKFLSVMDSL